VAIAANCFLSCHCCWCGSFYLFIANLLTPSECPQVHFQTPVDPSCCPAYESNPICRSSANIRWLIYDRTRDSPGLSFAFCFSFGMKIKQQTPDGNQRKAHKTILSMRLRWLFTLKELKRLNGWVRSNGKAWIIWFFTCNTKDVQTALQMKI